MTLNGVMALILRYVAEFVYDVSVKQLPRSPNLLLIVYDHINTICAIIQRLLGHPDMSSVSPAVGDECGSTADLSPEAL